jgi:hypothetical protein
MNRGAIGPSVLIFAVRFYFPTMHCWSLPSDVKSVESSKDSPAGTSPDQVAS